MARLAAQPLAWKIRAEPHQFEETRNEFVVVASAVRRQELPDDAMSGRHFEDAAVVGFGNQGVSVWEPLHGSEEGRMEELAVLFAVTPEHLLRQGVEFQHAGAFPESCVVEDQHPPVIEKHRLVLVAPQAE